ncbi:hypothetical protein E8E14_011689 [Neopestalotiopsis sp. 37M]|nr:hypothetical protein E8E14_011689 [Neopestalotiopsis sp. 37M]
MSRKAPKGEWIETDTGNKVNRKATLVGTQHIMLGGKTVIMPEAMIRGDLARTVPSTNPSQPGSNTAVFIGRVFTYMPLRLGDHVFIGEGTVVQAATIGSHVNIGKGAVVGEFAIVKDYVQILDGTIVPTNMVIPSFSIVAGQPARIIGEVPEGGHDAFELRDLYKSVKTTAPAPVV